ncbi:nucleotidyltransferase domain-containing protein [Pelotomaculum isophthalicicum JI]|uniref:Nucleotidyltransferase domain-containing protein n=1 Tax=Pelotomaculum isophthalicicum JI TaxID=947010 RepID=A0A9X4H0J9_9FIRM|nr:nucleotidyltransferase domain-containing protein [Pelotomaculum isophthalicicum]MDF9406811.1 nucleotidyltransferase domain-containing protein [Pelotomaculum isophthalicicum JI]
MLDVKTISVLQKILNKYPDVIAVYLFGSYIERREQARDVDLAILLAHSKISQVNLYLELYPRLAEVFAPLDVDLLFLNSASLPLRFEVISTGRVIYCINDDLRTDFEYIVSGEYMDFKYHLEAARRELFESIKEGAFLV